MLDESVGYAALKKSHESNLAIMQMKLEAQYDKELKRVKNEIELAYNQKLKDVMAESGSDYKQGLEKLKGEIAELTAQLSTANKEKDDYKKRADRLETKLKFYI